MAVAKNKWLNVKRATSASKNCVYNKVGLPFLKLLSCPLKFMIPVSHTREIRKKHIELRVGSRQHHKLWTDKRENRLYHAFQYWRMQMFNPNNNNKPPSTVQQQIKPMQLKGLNIKIEWGPSFR